LYITKRHYLFKFTQYSVITIKEKTDKYREYKEELRDYKYYLKSTPYKHTMIPVALGHTIDLA